MEGPVSTVACIHRVGGNSPEVIDGSPLQPKDFLGKGLTGCFALGRGCGSVVRGLPVFKRAVAGQVAVVVQGAVEGGRGLANR